MQNQMTLPQIQEAITEEVAAVIPILPEQNRFELLGYVRAVRDLTVGRISQSAAPMPRVKEEK